MLQARWIMLRFLLRELKMTTDEIISRCYEHGQPDYVLAADRLKELQTQLSARPPSDQMQRAFANANVPELPDTLTPPAIDQLFARDDLYTARAVFGRLRNFGYVLTLSAPVLPANGATEKRLKLSDVIEILESAANDARTANIDGFKALTDIAALLKRKATISPSGATPPVRGDREPWRERWFGSEPQRGWSIMQGREVVAYIGGDETLSSAVTAIVMAHNAALSLPVQPGAGERSTILSDLADWCNVERAKIGAIDGYDYRSGEEFGLRRVEIEINKRLDSRQAQHSSSESES